jgi:hypothetical protein
VCGSQRRIDELARAAHPRIGSCALVCFFEGCLLNKQVAAAVLPHASGSASLGCAAEQPCCDRPWALVWALGWLGSH